MQREKFCYRVTSRKEFASSSNKELLLINKKFIAAMNYLVKFIECIFKTFEQKDNNVDAEEHIISPNLFEVPNSVHLFYSFKEFVKMFCEFTNNILDVRIN